MEKAKKVFKITKNILSVSIIILLIFVIIMFFVSRITGNVPSIFGYSVYRVTTGSMVPELKVGDVILDKKVEDYNTLKVGDVVTFEGSGQMEGNLITHKIIKAPYKDNFGELCVQTKGVANDIADNPIPTSKIVGIMVCKIPYLDALYNLFFSPWGLVIFIGLILLVFADELIVIIKILTGHGEYEPKKEDINDRIKRIQEENQAKNQENQQENQDK